MTFRAQTLLWMAQRASAAMLALCVLVHLATLIYAVQGGLSAAEILGRTRGNIAWLGFYSLFVLAIVVHVPIGLRNILSEACGWRGAGVDIAVMAIALTLAMWGFRAVYAVFI